MCDRNADALTDGDQTEVLLERVEVRVRVEQGQPCFDAVGRDDAIDRFPDRDPELPQRPVVRNRLQGDGAIEDFVTREPHHLPPHSRVLKVIFEATEDFHQDQVGRFGSAVEEHLRERARRR